MSIVSRAACVYVVVVFVVGNVDCPISARARAERDGVRRVVGAPRNVHITQICERSDTIKRHCTAFENYIYAITSERHLNLAMRNFGIFICIFGIVRIADGLILFIGQIARSKFKFTYYIAIRIEEEHQRGIEVSVQSGACGACFAGLIWLIGYLQRHVAHAFANLLRAGHVEVVLT